MILYSTLGVSDFDRSIRFYDAVLATLGMDRAPDWTDGFMGWGKPYGQGYSLWICKPFDGKAPAPGNGPMLAFAASSAAQVRAFHAAALANGGSDDGAPGTRSYYEPSFYVCYVRDPDGNKLACVHHRYTGA
ncbi:MAG: VOC family protein [Proteobacteria bacterium]|nr:VOC family protein [Pseudomonadota bacterium]